MRQFRFTLFIAFAFFLFAPKLFSQADTAVVSDNALGGAAKISWDSIKGNWTKNILPGLLKKSHIDLSCRNCPEVIMVVEFTIDSTGKVTAYKVDSGKKCGEKFPQGLEKQYLDYFLKLTFPPDLWGKRIKARLGTSLVCG